MNTKSLLLVGVFFSGIYAFAAEVKKPSEPVSVGHESGYALKSSGPQTKPVQVQVQTNTANTTSTTTSTTSMTAPAPQGSTGSGKIKVIVGSCANPVKSLPKAGTLFLENKKFSTQEEALAYSHKMFAFQESQLSKIYCNTEKVIVQNGISATCRGKAGGSSGVESDDQTIANTVINSLECDLLIDCNVTFASDVYESEFNDSVETQTKSCKDRFELAEHKAEKKAEEPKIKNSVGVDKAQ